MNRVRQLFLMVHGLERSRQFYESLLGLQPRRVGDGSVSYRTGSCELKIQSDFDPETLREFNLSPPPADDPRGAGTVFVMEIDQHDLQTFHSKAEQWMRDHPGEVVCEPRNVPWLDRPMFLLRDPDGYVFECRSSGSPADEHA